MIGCAETEKAFISCILKNNNLYYKFPLSADDFTNHDCITLWTNIVDMFNSNSPVDPITLISYREQRKLPMMATFINDLVDNNSSMANVKHYVDDIVKFSTLRKFKSLQHIIPDILNTVGHDPNVAFEKLNTTITDMLLTTGSKTVTLSEAYRGLIDDIQNPKPKPRFIPTGYDDLDSIISGWRPGNLHIIAARPRTGKTASALNFAHRVASKCYTVGFWTGEMSIDDCIERLASIDSHVNAKIIKDRKINQSNFESLLNTGQKFDKMKWHFADKPRMHINEVEILIKKLKYTYNIDIFFIDQLSKIYGGSGFKKTEQIEDITGRLKALAKELDIPIILLAQINRDGTELPTLENLKDSGAIEQDADVVIILHRPEFIEPRPDNLGILEFHIPKDRHGEGGMQKFMFFTQTQTIEQLGRIV